MRHRSLFVSLAAPALAGLLLTSTAPAQQLSHVRVDHPNAELIAEILEDDGQDIVEGGVTAGSFELIGTAADLALLEQQGYDVTLIAHSRPLAAIQAEQGDVPGYPTLADILQEMQDAETNFPGICQLVNLTTKYGTPQTFEGRDMYAVKISDNVAVDEDEPSFLMVSNHHCRETVTPVIALDSISRLTSGYGVDPDITQVVDDNEIWIAPVWNPDGYVYVFNVNSMWRKNRREFPTGVGVDLNRNYPFGWNTACAGSSSVNSSTYKGPDPASEPETQTMIAWSFDRHFAKVIDFHSSGRETLWGYACLNHPLDEYYKLMATFISQNSGYGGRERPPSAEGEHYEWQLGTFGNFAFLTETATSFQPPYASAVAEAAMVWPGTMWMLQRPIPARGHVTDVCTDQDVGADVTIPSLSFVNGETNFSGGPFNTYNVFVPPATWNIDFDAAGYTTATTGVTVTPSSANVVDIAMTRDALALDIIPSSAGLTDPVAFHTCAGQASSLASLYIADVSGIPFFQRVAKGTFDANGSWTLNAGIPNDPTLSGLVITFLAFGLDGTTGTPSAAGPAVLTIL